MSVPPAHQGLIDPDVDRVAGRPLSLRGRYLYVVFSGGMLGTLTRWAVTQWLPTRAGWPWATLAVNLSGAFALGLLLEVLLRHGPDRGWPRLARLHFGTGFLGAFTTYSALAVESILLAGAGRPWLAAGYLAASVACGQLLAFAGIGLGIWLDGHRS